MLDMSALGERQGPTLEDILNRQHFDIKLKHQLTRNAILQGGGMDRIINSSKELVAAALLHFESEEIVMNTNMLRSFKAHRRIHAEMVSSLEDIAQDLEKRRIRGAMELMKLFDSRLIFHLDVEDAEMERELSN